MHLISENQNLIHKVCNMYMDNEDDRRDLFQEVMLQLWLSYPTFQKKAKITTWMYKIALYTAISVFRKAKRQEKHREKLLAESEVISSEIPIQEETDLHLLQKCIDRLSDTDKGLMLLYLEEHSYREMSEILGISESNVGVRINRIKGKLRNMFKSVAQ